MKKKRMMSLLLVMVMVVTMFAGCQKGDGQEENDGKISISMYAWGRSMFKEFTPWWNRNSLILSLRLFRATTLWIVIRTCWTVGYVP